MLKLIRTKVNCLLLFVLISSPWALSQETPTIIPPAPNAANLGQFINTPLGLYTGTPQISIPIWTIVEGQLSLPISLSYKAGGIKVSEIASSCGLGWVLNAGGAVTRSVVGLPDETPSFGYLYSRFPYNAHNNDYLYALSIANETTDGQQDMFYYSLADKSGRFVFDKNQVIHTIPRQNIVINPETPSLINFDNPLGYGGINTCFPGWTITDDNGVTYKFQSYEKTIHLSREREEIGTGIWNPGSRGINAWYVTEITSPTGDLISFNYDDVDLSYDLPGSKTTYIKISGAGTYQMPSSHTVQRQYATIKRLRSIVFSTGKIEFIPSSIGRADLIGDNALEKIVIEDKNGNIIKQFKFNYQYLVGNSLVAFNAVNFTGENNTITYHEASLPGSFKRRLVLQQIVEQDKNGVTLNTGYQFDYLHEHGLPNRASELMDHWGYANKADDPQQDRPSFVYANNEYQVTGKAPNYNYAKEGSLYRINYPTGGFAEYEFESNCIGASPSSTPNYTRGSIASLSFAHAAYDFLEMDYEEKLWMGATTRHYYTEFQVTASTSDIKVNIRNAPYYSTGVLGFYIENTNNPNHVLWTGTANGTYSVGLSAGTYRLYHYPSTDLLATPGNPDYDVLYEATVEATFEIPPISSGNSMIGGIRVKKLKLFDPAANSTINKVYSYELDGCSGQALAAPVYVYDLWAQTPEEHLYKACFYNSIYPLSTTHGSYVGYSFVEEKTISSDGTPLGKTEYSYIGPSLQPDLLYKFGIFDFFSALFFYSSIYPNPPTDNRDWLRGYLTRQGDYQFKDNTYIPVRTILNTYSKSIEIVSKGIKMDITDRDIESGEHSFARNEYYIYSGHIYPGETKEIIYDGSNSITTTSVVVNSEKSLMPVKKSIYKSNGSITHNFISYPLEYAAGEPFIDNLIQKNILSVPIETVAVKETNSGGLQIIGGGMSTYRIDNSLKDDEYLLETNTPIPLASFKFSNTAVGQIPTPTNQSVYLADNRYQLRLKYNAYDSKGNVLELQKTNDIKKSYIWDHFGAYPVAEVLNSSSSEAAYTSFEADGTGNWSGINTGNIENDPDCITGTKRYTITGSTITRPGLSTTTRYIVSYWGKSAPCSVSGTQAGWPKTYQTITVNGQVWTNYQHEVTNVSSISITGTGIIDELRLYPKGAEMTTYTYNPLIGMTSQCDTRDYITYYEYDNFNRLVRIRDADKNILKQYDYQYSAFYHTNAVWQATLNTRCKACPSNSNYFTNILQQEEKDINPQSATYGQLRWTDAGVSENCAPQPDWQNTATTIRCKKNALNHNTGEQEQEQIDMNPCSVTYNQTRWIVININTTACPLPPNCNNCTGNDKKCINNVCETGVRKNTATNWTGTAWQCTYHYEWSDGSLSQDYTEINSEACSLSGIGD